MFRSAATKIAHNSTIPALAGNQDLRPLQDLIVAEKAVIISLQKLAADFSKASEALKTWGLGEGDDLGNILSASTAIITHFTSAVTQYASHGHTMREQLKAIRTREEHLDELRRRRRNLMSKADSAEKKLQKMGPEHKNLVQQTDTLNRLREEIRGLDVEIMRQEAAIGDFKRTATRSWMGLKFGGLLECCDKGVIVGEYGKLVVAEIPEDETQPGLPRNPYFGHAKIEGLLAETHRYVNEVRLSTVPSSTTIAASTTQPHNFNQQLPQIPSITEPPFPGQQGTFSPTPNLTQQQQPIPVIDSSYTGYDRRDVLPEHPSIGTGRMLDSPVDAIHPSPFSSSQGYRESQYSGSLSNVPAGRYGGGGNVDEFGSSSGPMDVSSASGGGGGGRFATFPVRSRTGSGSASGPGGPGVGAYNQYRIETPPIHEHETSSFSLLSTPPQRKQSDSFASSVAQALAATSGSDHRTQTTSGGYTGVGEIQQDDYDDGPLPPPGRPGRLSKDGPAPSYESSIHDSEVNSWVRNGPSADGASAPVTSGGTGGAGVGATGSGGGAGTTRSGLGLDDGTISDDEEDEAVLAYNTSPPLTHPPTTTTLGASGASVDDRHTSRHVRFGTVSDIDSPDASPSALPPITPQDSTFSSPAVSPEPGLAVRGEGATGGGGSGLRGREDDSWSRDAARVRESHVIINPEEQEKVLNAAAAREVALELQQSKLVSTSTSTTTRGLPPGPAPVPTTSIAASNATAPSISGVTPSPQAPSYDDDPPPPAREMSISPLGPPPMAAFMNANRRSVSPRPPIGVGPPLAVAENASATPPTITTANMNTTVRGVSPELPPSPGTLPSYTEEPAGVSSSYSGQVPVPPLQRQQQQQERNEERSQQEFEEELFNPYQEHHQQQQQHQREVYHDYDRDHEPYEHDQEREKSSYSTQPTSTPHGAYSYYEDAPPVPPPSESKSYGSSPGFEQPLEQPNAPYMRSGTGANRSTSSLNSGVGSGVNAGGGKISAAAFKRPSPRPGNSASPFASPLSSQFPSGGGFRSTSPSAPGMGMSRLMEQPTGSIRLPPSPFASDPSPLATSGYNSNSQNTLPLNVHKQQQQEKRETRELDVDQYEYINAYIDNASGDEGVHGRGGGSETRGAYDYYTEQQAQRAANANAGGGGWAGIGSGGGVPQAHGQAQAQGQGQGGGYGQGRFATNLEHENEGLR